MGRLNGTLVIFGCGGHCRSVTDVLIKNESLVNVLIVDRNAQDGELVSGFPVFKSYSLSDESVFLAIGDNHARMKAGESIDQSKLVSIVSCDAHQGAFSNIGAGCFVGNFCHIGPQADIGVNTILNTGSIIEHEVVIGDHSHIAPNAVISGRCTIGQLVMIGAGATVIDNISICSGVTVGAGATVVQDIKEPGVYVGCPARKIR